MAEAMKAKEVSAASKSTSAGENAPAFTENDIDIESMSPVNAQDVRAWFKKSPGAYAFGIWRGRFEKTWKDDNDGKFYHQVQLLHPCMAMVPKKDAQGNDTGEGSQEQKLNPGDIVNVDETAQLESLKKLETMDPKRYPHGAVVFIKCIKKEAIKGTAKTIWRYDVRERAAKSNESPF